jgi:hypothetical protein
MVSRAWPFSRCSTLQFPDQLLPALLQGQQFLAILGAQIDDFGHSSHAALDPLKLQTRDRIPEFAGYVVVVPLQLPGGEFLQV